MNTFNFASSTWLFHRSPSRISSQREETESLRRDVVSSLGKTSGHQPFFGSIRFPRDVAGVISKLKRRAICQESSWPAGQWPISYARWPKVTVEGSSRFDVSYRMSQLVIVSVPKTEETSRFFYRWMDKVSLAGGSVTGEQFLSSLPQHSIAIT